MQQRTILAHVPSPGRGCGGGGWCGGRGGEGGGGEGGGGAMLIHCSMWKQPQLSLCLALPPRLPGYPVGFIVTSSRFICQLKSARVIGVAMGYPVPSISR